MVESYYLSFFNNLKNYLEANRTIDCVITIVTGTITMDRVGLRRCMPVIALMFFLQILWFAYFNHDYLIH